VNDFVLFTDSVSDLSCDSEGHNSTPFAAQSNAGGDAVVSTATQMQCCPTDAVTADDQPVEADAVPTLR